MESKKIKPDELYARIGEILPNRFQNSLEHARTQFLPRLDCGLSTKTPATFGV